MISALDSKVMDVNAAALGIGTDVLMGNAGKEIARFVSENYAGKRIGIVCGHGNNGGDGYAAASFLQKADVKLYTIDALEKVKSQTVKDFISKTGRKVEPFSSCDFNFDVLIDCGLGTGISGDLRPQYTEYIKEANSFEGTIISVDVPTGFGTKTCIKPDVTITMHDVKKNMTESNCGKIIIADIGMPPDAYLRTGPGDMLRYPIPRPDSHKGANGKLLIIGGGPYFGAPAMAAMAALRTGTDLVTVAAPDSVYHEIAAVNPTLMIQGLSGDKLTTDHLLDLLALSERNDAVLLGPGLGIDPDTVKAVNIFIKMCNRPMVIDADGINALHKDFKAKVPTVLTPHIAEFGRLTGVKPENEETVSKAAFERGCVIVLKGREDIITVGKMTRRNGTGCAGMTGAGTGDVLAGITAALLSKGLSPFDAGCLGTYISGLAGELAFEERSYGMIATDVIDKIPTVLRNGLGDRKNR